MAHSGSPLGRTHPRLALAYVDQNPVRAGLAGRGTEYPWSSARSHVQRKDPAGLLDLEAWRQIDTSGDWAELLGHLAEDTERRKPSVL